MCFQLNSSDPSIDVQSILELLVKIRLGKKREAGENFYDVTFNVYLISVVSASDFIYCKHAVKLGFEANCFNSNPQSVKGKELISLFGNVFLGAILQNRSSDWVLIRNKGKNITILFKTLIF